ncbi:MAG: hypothetical protein WC370_07555 [Dehalococcoidales bacterium]|jgi:epoxyqueuosine reductase QueG
MTDKHADAIITEIKEFVRQSPLNRLPPAAAGPIFDEPLVQFADGADPLFQEYKTIIGDTHLTPREALAQITGKTPEELPERLTVISWILPITKKTRLTNRTETLRPSRPWSHTRWYGEVFNDALRRHVVAYLTGRGCLAAAPALPGHLKIFTDAGNIRSSWSERHIAYAAGLGTFSLSDGFITERGIAHRCGSVITGLAIPASPRAAAGPYANCLLYVKEKCGVCIERCPAQAISEKGHDKTRCSGYLHKIGYHTTGEYDLDISVFGCGLCQTKVPCESVNPTRQLKK